MLTLAIILSVAIGLALGLLGGGGSILTVPILVYALGLEDKVAIATSLLVVAVTSVFGALSYWRAGHVRWKTAAVFSPSAMAGAFAGGLVARFIPGPALLALFALLMIGTAITMWRGRREPEGAGHVGKLAWLLVVGEGAVVGFITGLVGAGGGFLVVPALVLLGGLGMRDAVGTSLVIIAVKSAAGFLGYVSHVPIDVTLAAVVTVGAIAGTVGGAILAPRIPQRKLRRGFAAFVAVMAVYMLANEIPGAWMETVVAQVHWMALGGGALIGLAATLLLAFNGRIAGVSGILAGTLTGRGGGRGWRLFFLAGLLAGGSLFVAFAPDMMPAALPRSAPVVALAGLLVGYGTQLGSGCTSGHGVCGIGRLTTRSMVATVTFVLAAMITVFFVGAA